MIAWCVLFFLPFNITVVVPMDSDIAIVKHEIDYGNVIIFSAKFLVRYSCLVLISSNKKFTQDILIYNANFLYSSIILYNPYFKISLRREVSKEYMIVHDNIKEIGMIITNIRHHIQSNSLIFIVITRNCYDGNSTDEYKEMFNRTWSLYLKKVILYVQTTSGNYEENDVYTYNPFLNQIYQFNIKQISEINQQLVFKNYHKYQLKASLFESVPTTVKLKGDYIGIDPMVIHTIEETLNLSIITHEPYDGHLYGFKLLNGTAGGAIKELYSKEIDIAFNQVFIKEYNAPEMEFTNIIFRDSLCVIVPKAELVPNWMALFYTFPKRVWIVLFFTVTIGYFSLFLIRRLKVTITCKNNKKKRSNDYSWGTVILDVNQIFVSTAYAALFSNKYYERIFIGSILLYVLIINTLLQSSLVTVLTHHKRYPDINTLEDLAESGYYISTSSPSLADTFKGLDNPYIKKLNSRFRLIGFNGSYYKAYLARETKQNYLDKLKKSQEPSSHIVKECPRTFLLAYMTGKNAHFLEEFNNIIQAILSAGLVAKWYDTVMMNVSLTLPQNQLFEKGPEFPRPFSIIDLQTSFVILLTGLFVSLATFCIEMHLRRLTRGINGISICAKHRDHM